MQPDDLWRTYPVLYHIAWGGSWPNIRGIRFALYKGLAAPVRQERGRDRETYTLSPSPLGAN